MADPLVIHVPDVEISENFIEIIDARSGGRVVTVIEILSRSNKTAGSSRELYLQKQSETKEGRANLVEIDLLREGKWTTLTPPHLVPPEKLTPYHISVHRAVEPTKLQYYPAPLRQPLPTIRIPLRPTDADVPLNLQELINLSYSRGRYDDIDYRRPLNPPLPAEDEAWMELLLREKKLR